MTLFTLPPPLFLPQPGEELQPEGDEVPAAAAAPAPAPAAPEPDELIVAQVCGKLWAHGTCMLLI